MPLEIPSQSVAENVEPTRPVIRSLCQAGHERPAVTDKAVAMLILSLLILVLAAACVLAVRGVRADVAAEEPLIVPEALFAPESLEGVLCAQLMDGEITRRQYLRSMAGIAARDEERHPLTVPGYDD
ncbi:hypothetical protein Ait01nite_100110 [Actinoplanes italicus]|nr:hypothetical protein Ait01nite_100110 [Actinoplanes italicus]